MHSIGCGRSGAKRFSAFMNMLSPIVNLAWAAKTEQLYGVVSTVADKDMLAACEEVKGYSEVTKDISVSLDGSWQIKGMSSHHGLVTSISTDIGKVLDSHLLTNHCVVCDKWDSKDKDHEEYMDFYAYHFPNCPKNHDSYDSSFV